MACVLHAGNALGLPVGHPVYHPIYEAAAETGLAILFHPHDRGEVAGTPSTAIENFAHNGLRAMHDISSLIVHGVFEKYPHLTTVFTEFGFSWLPTLLANLDRSYETLKLESRWVKQLPSNYVRSNVRLGTQPVETNDRTALVRLLEAAPGVEDILCFSSDFPHYSMDDVDFVARAIPRAWHRKLFYENACDAFGWEHPQPAGAPLAAGGVR
jgi:predicted TIM-barrel fold metal-dependent hydrolase